MIKAVYRYLRRYYLLILRRKYVKESLLKRKGQCNKCGCCKDRLFPCKHYNYETKECSLYPDYKGFPYTCDIYPIDEKDQSEWSKEHCGFYWDKG